MNPVFSEYCKFLLDQVGLELQEGYYWYDKSIIKAYDKQGNIHKLYRLWIDDVTLGMSYTIPKSYDTVEDFEIASWDDIVQQNLSHLQQIENDALAFIQNKIQEYPNGMPIIPISTGKDSQVVCHLVRSLYPNTKAIFNNTSLDCMDTYKMARTIPKCDIMSPQEGFYQYIKRYNLLPSRFARFCCRLFKTGEMVKRLDKDTQYLLFMGMRNEESNTRKDYGDEIVNPEWGHTSWK